MESRKELHKNKQNNRLVILGIPLIILLTVIGLNFQKIQDQWNWLTMKQEQKLNVPEIKQLPDLPNGCEVTSLAMLLNYYKINVSKDTLASQIKHVDSYTQDGKMRGNPHTGFVGSMSVQNAGWCVYNEPLYNVARKYTNRIQNYTGHNFIDVLKLVSNGHPVMIITTLTFNHVDDMQTWNTPQGKVNVTPSSHACVITGYNKKTKKVYVNDPYGSKNKVVSWKNIAKSYNQQGKQALYVS